MTVHIVLLVYISFVGAVIYERRPYKDQMNKVFLSLSFFAIWLIEGLRGRSVGLDTNHYAIAFRRASIGYFPERWEFFFYLLIKILTKISKDPQILFLVSSFLILTGIWVFIYNNTEDESSAFWPIFLFIVLTQYFSTMNLVRQSLAMAVGCNVYTVLKKDQSKKGFLKSAILVVIATLFHTSGLVCVLFMLPFLLKINRKTITVGTAVIFGLLYLFPYVLRAFLWVFPRYLRYIGGKWDTAGTSGVYNLIGLFEFLIIVICMVYLDPDKEDNKEIYRLIFIILFSLASILMQRRISLARRLGYYFELFLILLIPEFTSKWKAKIRTVIKIGVYILGWAYFIYQMTVSNARGCVPYYFYWH